MYGVRCLPVPTVRSGGYGVRCMPDSFDFLIFTFDFN
jgi:hypothetical protein